ncbi:isopeptide-forming domain-containing fimbrial protein [Eubacterium aggregans]|uniref:isopeptide-forming domain-containing fimbrial protein n=1 Tax=Eubacterium aggregans TaxID=81409 RepID=UPI003F3F1CD1
MSTTLITKKVDTTNRTYSMGDDVPFTINVAFKNEAEGADTVNDVDDLKKDGTYGSLKIKDSLVDSLKYKESSLTLMKADGSSEGLSMGTDYSLEGDATGQLVWTLTDNGIDKAIAAHATAVEVKLTTTV